MVSSSSYSCSVYEDAVDKLVSLQSISSVFANSEKESKTQHYNVRNSNVEVTRVYLERLGITPADLKSLNVIHVAGTKGKGSTCALTESILRYSGYTTGFCSSPHLMEIRERIRLNGQVISRELFGKYFHEMWEKFGECEIANEDGLARYPSFIKYLVVMSYYVFLKEKVSVAIIEVGLGGKYDCTNVISEPVVTAITHLGYDHCSILGNTIGEIAWEKAGIIKHGVPVLTVPQYYKESVPVLQKAADSHSTCLVTVPALEKYPNAPSSAATSQTWSDNISLALQVAKTWLTAHKLGSGSYPNGKSITCQTAAPFLIPKPFLEGIERCQWPGRNHVVYRGGVNFYLDGAHTPVSVEMCSKWFGRCSGTTPQRKRILIANTTRDRQMKDFLNIITKEISLDEVIFCPNIASNNYVVKDCEWPEDIKKGMVKRAEENKNHWTEICPGIPAFSFSSVEEAVSYVEGCGMEADVLVTGSLHLIGATLQVLQPNFLDEQLHSNQSRSALFAE